MQKVLEKVKGFDFKMYFKTHSYELVAYLGFIICLIVFSIVPPILNSRVSIWKPNTLAVFIEQVTVLMILGIGASFVYMMGCMDISVGYQVGVFGTLFILIVNASGSVIVAILTMLALGIVCAVFNAFVGAYVKLPTVMSSVILMQLFSGLMTTLYSDSSLAGRTLEKLDLAVVSSTWFRVLTIVVLAIVGFYIMNFTKTGKRAKAIGANKKAASQAGANLLKTRILCFAIFSVFLCIAAIFLIARKNGIGETDSASYQMDIMIMLLMGGMPLSGGMKGKLSNAIVGTLTYCLIDLGLGLCSVPAEYIFLIKAIIFVSIVAVTCRKPGITLPR